MFLLVLYLKMCPTKRISFSIWMWALGLFLRFRLYFCHVYVYGFRNVSEGACDVQNKAWDPLELEL